MDVDWKDVLNLAFWSIRLHDSFLSSTFRVPYSGGIAFRHRVLLWNFWNCLHYINKTSLFFQRLLRWKWNYFRFRYFVPSVLNCSRFYSSTWFDCRCIFHWSPRWDVFPSKSIRSNGSALRSAGKLFFSSECAIRYSALKPTPTTDKLNSEKGNKTSDKSNFMWWV